MPTTKKESQRYSVKRYKATGREGRSYWQWKVEGRDFAKAPRYRKFFEYSPAGKAEAQAHAQEKNLACANRESDLRSMLTRIPADAAADVEKAYHRLSEAYPKWSLSFAVDFFIERFKEPRTDLCLPALFEMFEKDHKANLRKASHTMFGNVKRFCDAHPKLKPHNVTAEIVKTHLQALRGDAVIDEAGVSVCPPAAPKTYNNNRHDVHKFFQWCREQDLLKDHPFNEVTVPVRKVVYGMPKVIPLHTIIQLLHFVCHFDGGSLAPYFSFMFFGSMRGCVRSGEIRRLAANMSNPAVMVIKTRTIRISNDLAKTKTTRPIEMQPALVAWLRSYPESRYPLLPKNVEDKLARIRKLFGLPKNVLRHVHISMHVAKFKNLAHAALLAGTSEAVIKRHYYAVFTEAEAEAFWAITPQSLAADAVAHQAMKVVAEQFERSRDANWSDANLAALLQVDVGLKHAAEMRALTPRPTPKQLYEGMRDLERRLEASANSPEVRYLEQQEEEGANVATEFGPDGDDESVSAAASAPGASQAGAAANSD